MDLTKIVNRVITIITNPRTALQNIKNENLTQQDIIIYLAIVAIPTLIGFILGYGFVGYGLWGPAIGAAVGAGIIYYFLAIIGIILFGIIFNALASSFKSQENLMMALKLVAFASTPWLMAGIFYLYPPIWILVPLAGLYGLYILYIGIPIMMGTPQDQQIVYLLISIFIFVIIMFAIWFIAHQIMWQIFGSIYGP